MTITVFGAKAAVAVVLLVAGGAKLADLDGFAAAIDLFLPGRLLHASGLRRRLLPAAAAAIAASELLLGAVSLCWPGAVWVNLAVLALACGFTAVAAIGYAAHRGQSCRCFGALSRREFGPRALAQALLVTAAACLAIRPVAATQLQLGLAAHLLLLVAACVTALAAYAAAGALLLSGGTTPQIPPMAADRAGPGMAG